MDYKKLYTKQFALEHSKKSKDELEWSHFDFPKTVKESFPIEYIDVCEVPPFPVAITARTRVLLCETETSPPDYTLSSFTKPVYGSRFRGDGKLLALGSEQNVVKLFDYKKRTLLRTISCHTCPVHRVAFIMQKPEIVSFSDDKTINIWDIYSEKVKQTFTGHTDMIRAGITSSTCDNIIISGSYDHTVKVWDTRMESSVITFSHGSNVESLLLFPMGSRFASAGVADLTIWDFVAKKAIKNFSVHHKSITSLSYVSKTNTLLSGSLDRHVKIYNMNKMKCLHTLDYPSPILSLGITNTASTLVVGMCAGDSGLISFRHANRVKKTSLLGEDLIRQANYKETQLNKVSMKYTTAGTNQLNEAEKYLKQFDFVKCLNVISQKESISQPANVVAVYQKLLQQNVLKNALEVSHKHVILFATNFIIRYFTEPHYTRLLAIVVDILIELNTSSKNKKVYGGFIEKLQEENNVHIRKAKTMGEVNAMAEMVLAVKATRRAASPGNDELTIKDDEIKKYKKNTKMTAIFEVM